MDTSKLDPKNALTKLATLRDEIRVQLHLASLDAKKEWDEVLAPKVAELEEKARVEGGVLGGALEVVAKLEHFAERLRAPKPPATG